MTATKFGFPVDGTVYSAQQIHDMMRRANEDMMDIIKEQNLHLEDQGAAAAGDPHDRHEQKKHHGVITPRGNILYNQQYHQLLHKLPVTVHMSKKDNMDVNDGEALRV